MKKAYRTMGHHKKEHHKKEFQKEIRKRKG